MLIQKGEEIIDNGRSLTKGLTANTKPSNNEHLLFGLIDDKKGSAGIAADGKIEFAGEKGISQETARVFGEENKLLNGLKSVTDRKIDQLGHELRVQRVALNSEPVKAGFPIFINGIDFNGQPKAFGLPLSMDTAGANPVPIEAMVESGGSEQFITDSEMNGTLNENTLADQFQKLFGKDTKADSNFDKVAELKHIQNGKVVSESIYRADISRIAESSKEKELSAMKFVLPAELNSKSVNKQTISIKLIPEHLGTVRLTLSSLHDVVTGRIIVENMAAMTTVESNLGSLLEDLAERGITVDAFQVSVAGGQTGRHFSQSQSAPGPRGKMQGNDITDKVESDPMADSGSRAGRQYVGAQGVNLLI
jgi:hypothetical protein